MTSHRLFDELAKPSEDQIAVSSQSTVEIDKGLQASGALSSRNTTSPFPTSNTRRT